MTRADDNSVQIQWTYGGEFEVEMEVHSEGRYWNLLHTVTLPRDASERQFSPDPVPRGWFYFRFREKQSCQEKGRMVSDHGPWLGHAKAYLRGRAMFSPRMDPPMGFIPDGSIPPDPAPQAGGCAVFCPGDRYSGQCHAGDYVLHGCTRYYTVAARSRGSASIGVWPEREDGRPIDTPVTICGHNEEGRPPTQCEWVVVQVRGTCSQ